MCQFKLNYSAHCFHTLVVKCMYLEITNVFSYSHLSIVDIFIYLTSLSDVNVFFYKVHEYLISLFKTMLTSARPEVRGTADVGWRSLFPLPFNPPRTHQNSDAALSSHVSTDRRAVTDMNGKTRTLRCAPFLCRSRRRECCMLGVPSSQPTVPQHELPPASLVIHRQTSAHERR